MNIDLLYIKDNKLVILVEGSIVYDETGETFDRDYSAVLKKLRVKNLEGLKIKYPEKVSFRAYKKEKKIGKPKKKFKILCRNINGSKHMLSSVLKASKVLNISRGRIYRSIREGDIIDGWKFKKVNIN